MSADNGIYILKSIRTRKLDGNAWVKTKPYAVFRVGYASAIDNFDYYKNKQTYNLGAYMKEVWGSSPVFEDELEAFSYAWELAKNIPILEYGISKIETKYIFYGDM